MDSNVPSHWLPSNIQATRPVLKISRMALYFLDNPHSDIRTLHNYANSLIVMVVDRDRKRAHFYVYCAWPCKELKLGKLRVRCASCRGGAFTVDRDPQCWDDVLEGKRITGDCQNDGCVSE